MISYYHEQKTGVYDAINIFTPCKTNFVFEVQHPKHITAEEIASKMEGGQNCLTFKVLNYEAAK